MGPFDQSQEPMCPEKDNSHPASTEFDQYCDTGVEPEVAIINGPHLERKLFCLGIPQLVCGILIVCGLGLYVGVNLGAMRSTEEVNGCRYIMEHWEFQYYYLPCSLAGIILACLVSLILLE